MESMIEDLKQCESKFVRQDPHSNHLPAEEPISEQSQAQRSNGYPSQADGRHLSQGSSHQGPAGSSGAKMKPSAPLEASASPTPAGESLRTPSRSQATIPSRAKRKMAQEEVTGAHEESIDNRAYKRTRTSVSMSHGKGRESLRSGYMPRSDGGHNEGQGIDDPLMREVLEELAAQDERKRRAAVKKRKRESGGSDRPAAHSNEHEDSAKSERPKRKKPKTTSSTSASEDHSSASNVPSTQSRHTTPLRGQGRKRASPAAEYLNSILTNAESNRVKRQKA